MANNCLKGYLILTSLAGLYPIERTGAPGRQNIAGGLFEPTDWKAISEKYLTETIYVGLPGKVITLDYADFIQSPAKGKDNP